MAPKGTNTKKEAGRAKKAENEEIKKQSAASAKEKADDDKWSQGAKSAKSKEEKEEKRKAEQARKAENARLLAEEEAAAPAKPKANPKAGTKKAAAANKSKPAGPGAIAATSTSASASTDPMEQVTQQFSATGIDDALELMEVINAKTDKASTGAAAAGIERHPERRFKAAFEAYQEKELPNIKEDHPGLRLQQYKELLFKQFQKSPDNPYNQTVVDYNASKEDKVNVLKQRRADIEQRLRE